MVTEAQMLQILGEEIRLVAKRDHDCPDCGESTVWMVKPGTLERAVSRIAALDAVASARTETATTKWNDEPDPSRDWYITIAEIAADIGCDPTGAPYVAGLVSELGSEIYNEYFDRDAVNKMFKRCRDALTAQAAEIERLQESSSAGWAIAKARAGLINEQAAALAAKDAECERLRERLRQAELRIGS